jgi:hypothetical protein
VDQAADPVLDQPKPAPEVKTPPPVRGPVKNPARRHENATLAADRRGEPCACDDKTRALPMPS